MIRVALSLDADLRGSVLEAVREESPTRFRFVFVRDSRPLTLLVSLDPRMPWIGRPPRRRKGEAAPRTPRPFGATLARQLRGGVLAGVLKPEAIDRRVELRFAVGQLLVAELGGAPSDLVLLGAGGLVVARAGRGRSSCGRLALGQAYVPRPAPAGLLDPFSASAAEIDAELVRRGRLAGIGESTLGLAIEESRRLERSAGEVLRERLAAVLAGRLDPVIEAPGPPGEATDPRTCRLLPWDSPIPAAPPLARSREADPAGTAGLFHESVERAEAWSQRFGSLQAILSREIRHLREVASRIEEDAARFDRPEVWRRQGEALLAGLHRAKRCGSTVFVPDPYDPAAAPLAVPVEGGASLPQAAEACFRRYRRARRGLEHAKERAAQVAARRLKLLGLLSADTPRPGAAEVLALERTMRDAGIPVALEATPRAAPASPERRPRVVGVRIFRTADGLTALVGKSGKDNARLTFRLSGPEDFWFHALGVPGAHVIVRNDERAARPPQGTLEQAAAAAAWFSEAQSQPQVDVQWTRRKYVRPVRGAAPGTVRLKRFETVRVKPRLPGVLTLLPGLP